MKQDIEIEIGELVLHGFVPHDLKGIRYAVEMELTRLLTERGIPASLTLPKKINGINAGGFTMQPGAQAGIIGNDIATAVYQGLEKSKSPLKK
jgi:hypothetical protein